MSLPDEQHAAPRVGPSAEGTLLTLAVLALVVVLLSIITFVPRGSGPDGRPIASGGGGGGGSDEGGDFGLGADPAAADGGPGGAGGSSGGGGGTSGGGTSGGGGSAGALPNIDCKTGKNGGNTDTGVTGNSILLGAVTVESGPGRSFLQPETVAMQAVVSKVNSAGGICGRRIQLKLRDSGWDGSVGAQYIQNMVEGDKVFALAVNPDSEGLEKASSSGYLGKQKVPVIGTDGLLYSQYTDPYIWPIATSTVSAMHAIAESQHKSGKRHFSLVYETTYRFGREGANAYNNTVKKLTGNNIPGYSDPDKNPQCAGRFCGIVASQQAYGSNANTINSACTNAPGCDAGAVLLEPATALTWFSSGGAFGGVSDPSGGAGAAPQPLFARSFADGCQRKCDNLRLWTGFNPPIEQFASIPGVQQYMQDMKAFSSSVDVDNQFAEGAYLGMRLTVDVLTKASALGLTRENVVRILDSTSNYDIGLSVRPLTWSKGNHFPQATVHAFDESYPAGFGGWHFVQGSTIDDPDPRRI
ncbi:MAG TPA: ABC transporter substrate-binding protein [Acidimicrobiales bacterium]|nr:ABC transporter substrate-binding protein [Acidimicrobiales bacterium]